MSTTDSVLADEKERYRSLWQREKQRADHLSLIASVQRAVLKNLSVSRFLPVVVDALSGHYHHCEVAVYLREPLQADDSQNTDEAQPLVLSPAGHKGDWGLIDKTTWLSGEITNISLKCATENRAVCVNFPQQLRRECEPAKDGDDVARLSLPITDQGRVLGVLALASRSHDALDAADIPILEMITAILGARIEASLVYDQMHELNTFQQTLFSTMLHSLLVIDEKYEIVAANDRFRQTTGIAAQKLKGATLQSVFGETSLSQHEIMESLKDVINSGTPHELEEVYLSLPGLHFPDDIMVFDIRIFRVFYRGRPRAVMLFINLTARWRNFHQLKLMSEIGRVFSASLDVDKVLHTVLTCITAGNALGFNRGFLLLANEAGTQLQGTRALGPSSAAEAYEIWKGLDERRWSLQDIMAAGEQIEANSSPLQEKLSALTLDLKNPYLRTIKAAIDQENSMLGTLQDTEARNQQLQEMPDYEQQWQAARALFNAPQTVVAPLLAKGKLVGVVLADNIYSGTRIEEQDVQLLDNLAKQAGLAIVNAQTYEALRKSQRELVNAERLAAVGDMTTRLSHEIRNPLSTIGGFARRITKHPENEESVRRNATIIAEEIQWLEELLGDMLEMARSNVLQKEPADIHEVINKALLLADADFRKHNVTVEKDYHAQLPRISIDHSRILQVLLNIVRNGIQAMPEGGVLRVATQLRDSEKQPKLEIAITDQGEGIEGKVRQHIFDPFYSTKLRGSGLGLAVSWRIVQNHNGHISVDSAPDRGTTFRIALPLE